MIKKFELIILKLFTLAIISLIICLPIHVSTVYAVNRAPNVQGIPDVVFYENSYPELVIDLDNYVIDPDNDKEHLVWSATGGGMITLIIDADNNASFSIADPTDVTEEFTFTATDPSGLSDSDTISVKSMLWDDGGQACMDQKLSSSLQAVWFGDFGKKLQDIIAPIYAACITMNTIKETMAALSALVGSFLREPIIPWPECHVFIECISTCNDPFGVCKAACMFLLAICKSIDAVQTAVAETYAGTGLAYLCCIVTCNYCSGKTNYGGGVNQPEDPSGCANLIPIPTAIGYLEKFGGEALSVDPYENIYIAYLCACPTAVLMHQKKMNAIYETYECCIKKACEKGTTKQHCDEFLKEAECMYTEAAMQKAAITIIMAWISSYFGGMIATKELPEGTIWDWAYLELVVIPLRFYKLAQAWTFVLGSFDPPEDTDCDRWWDENFATTPSSYTGTSTTYYGGYIFTNIQGTGKQLFRNPVTGESWILERTAGYNNFLQGWLNGEIQGDFHTGDIINAEKLEGDVDKAIEKIVREDMIKDVLHNFLSETLGAWAYDKIDDQCKMETNSSRPLHNEPESSVISHSFAEYRYCLSLDTTTITAPGYITHNGNRDYNVDFTYSITACNKDIGTLTYNLWLMNPSKTVRQSVGSGEVKFDRTVSLDYTTNTETNFTQVCIRTNDLSSGDNGWYCEDLIYKNAAN